MWFPEPPCVGTVVLYIITLGGFFLAIPLDALCLMLLLLQKYTFISTKGIINMLTHIKHYILVWSAALIAAEFTESDAARELALGLGAYAAVWLGGYLQKPYFALGWAFLCAVRCRAHPTSCSDYDGLFLMRIVFASRLVWVSPIETTAPNRKRLFVLALFGLVFWTTYAPPLDPIGFAESAGHAFVRYHSLTPQPPSP